MFLTIENLVVNRAPAVSATSSSDASDAALDESAFLFAHGRLL